MNDGKKKRPQKYQNKEGFKIKFDTLALDIHKKVSLSLLCKRCADQISWKLQFNKYKKIAQPSKCNFCHSKNVVRSYMKSCDPCAQKEQVCPKCLSKDVEILEGDDVKLSEKQQKIKDKEQQKAMNDYIDTLRERSKRKVKRQYQKGIITWDNENKYFVDKQGNQLVGLKIKTKGLGDLSKQFDDDNFDDDDFMDDDEGSNNEYNEQGSQDNQKKIEKNKKNVQKQDVNKKDKQQKNKQNKKQGQETKENKDDENNQENQENGSQNFDDDQDFQDEGSEENEK